MELGWAGSPGGRLAHPGTNAWTTRLPPRTFRAPPVRSGYGKQRGCCKAGERAKARDLIADERDRAADERDRIAGARDRAADERDLFDAVHDRHNPDLDIGDNLLRHVDRLRGKDARDFAAQERDETATDREQAREERES